jgi:hypothetical protein
MAGHRSLQQKTQVNADQHPAFVCPLCHQPASQQRLFSTHERETVRVIVRCDSCRHRWSVLVPTAPAGDVRGPGT